MWQGSDDEKSSDGGGCTSFVRSLLRTYDQDPEVVRLGFEFWALAQHVHRVCNHLHRVIACFVVHAKKGHWELRTVDHCYFCFLNPSPKLGNEPTVATHNKPILILTVFIWWCACWTINLRNVAEGSTPREGPGRGDLEPLIGHSSTAINGV